ncbi:hypothetical protein D3C86_1795000 [compost metagenome]
MWRTIWSTCRLMMVTASWARMTLRSPERADIAVSSAMRATCWALSAIWRELASSSFMVLETSLIAAACSPDPVACWLAAA